MKVKSKGLQMRTFKAAQLRTGSFGQAPSALKDDTSRFQRRQLHASRFRRTADPANSVQSEHIVPANGAENTTAAKASPQSIDISTGVRKAMRSINAPIVLLSTTTVSNSEPGTLCASSKSPLPQDILSKLHEKYKCMTLSSFTTVTLDPTPIISFNIREPSQTLSAIKNSKFFLVHFLCGNAAGEGLADRFTKGNDFPGLYNELEFKEISNGLPWFTGVGVGHVLRCEVLSEQERGLIPVGDHVIVLAKVIEVLPVPRASTPITPAGLSYFDGTYTYPILPKV